MTAVAQTHLDVSMSNRGQLDIVLVPPQLPPFLATVFDLKPINGSPSTDEVKLVHGAIRALNGLLHTCYREKYPIGIFPNEVVYTPPDLPAHIPVKLEPVVGPPSDVQIRSAHAALRTSDSFTNVTLLFDEDLNVQLSQHLFDLQLARYVQRSIRPQPSGRNTAIDDLSSAPIDTPNLNTTDERGDPGVETRRQESTEQVETTAVQAETTASTEADNTQPQVITHHAQLPEPFGHDQAGSQESTRVLVEIREISQNMLGEIHEALKNMTKVMVASQNSLARGLNGGRPSYGLSNLGSHSLINDKGENV